MHIVHILTRLLRAGSEENTIATCRWQARAGHRVTLIHGPGADPWWDLNLPKGIARIEVPDLVHPLRPSRDLAALRQLREVIGELLPDVIHTHQSKAGILGRLAAPDWLGAVVVHGVHIVPFEGVSPARRMIYVAAEKAAARRTDLFLGVSEAAGAAYVKAGIARPEQVHCVRSGMDLDQFTAPSHPADWRGLLGLPEEAPQPQVALMMAAFEPRKRHVPFLHALASAREELPDFRLLLAGRGPEEARVRQTITALGLSDRVVLSGHRPDPQALFALADLSVLCSEREGLPRVVIQSIAAGCPPLVQALPGLDEVLEHGTNGWITRSGDMAGTVAQMGRLLTDRSRLAQLREGALNTDLQDWSLQTLGARTTDLYALARRRPTPQTQTAGVAAE